MKEEDNINVSSFLVSLLEREIGFLVSQK